MIYKANQSPGAADFQKMFGKDTGQPLNEAKNAGKTLSNNNGGGLGGAAKKTIEDRKSAGQDPNSFEYPEKEKQPVDDSPKQDVATLSNPKWIESITLFQQESEASVDVNLPKGKEHLTRVEAELFAKTSKGPESISKAEGHAQPNGTAVITLPVYKPKGHQDGVVEYFIEFTHKLAKSLTTEGLLRAVNKSALKAADHLLIPGILFPKNMSFIRPEAAAALKQLESKLSDWDRLYSKKGQIVIFGHADVDEKEPKSLSESRSQSAYAFITNDAEYWEKLYNSEKWGLLSLRLILTDLGDYSGLIDGHNGPKTQGAIRAFQKRSGIPETGYEDSATRKSIFTAYRKGKHDFKIESSRFRKVAGSPWMGCAVNNLTKISSKAAPENRRVTFMIIKEGKFSPVHFPCQEGSETACKAQCKKQGALSSEGIKCLFFDELVRETSQSSSAETETGVLKKADTGQAVEELNVRLSGFGGGVPRDTFDDETEDKVKRFQTEWMKDANLSAIFDLPTAKALDAFGTEFQIDVSSCKCKCGGFGKGKFKGKYQGSAHKESAHKYEYPGIHRSLIWALKGIKFHVKSLDYQFHEVSSAYRCWVDNENHDRKSTNHMGKALDITVADELGKKGGKAEFDKVRALLVEKMRGQIRWGSKDRFSMEPSDKNQPNEYVTTNWIHFYVREFDSKFLDDRYSCKDNESVNGKTVGSLLESK